MEREPRGCVRGQIEVVGLAVPDLPLDRKIEFGTTARIYFIF
jgi:hypothetical protein